MESGATDGSKCRTSKHILHRRKVCVASPVLIRHFEFISPLFVFPEEQREAPPEQPLLTGLNRAPGLHSIQESQAEYPHQPEGTEEPDQSRRSPTNNNSPSGNSPIIATRTVKLVLLKTAPDNHVDELNIRLQQIRQQGDINPSVGDGSDKESELNIRQLESSISSLSGVMSGSSQFNSPEANRAPKPKGTANYKIETDF